jgi:hypothetical protein
LNSTDSALISVHVAEYSSLRNEINAFHAVEGQMMNFSIFLLGALIGFANKAGELSSPWFFIFAPLPFFLLGTFFGYTQIRIIQVASYLTRDLRLRLVAAIGRDDIWSWEDFRRNRQLVDRQLVICPASGLAHVLSLLRWLLFVWPVALPIFLLCNNSIRTKLTDPLQISLTCLDFILFVLLAVFAWYCVRKLPQKVIQL